MNKIHENYFLPQGLPFESVDLNMPSKLVKIIAAGVAVVILIVCIVIVSVIVGTQNGTLETQNGQNKESGMQYHFVY